MSIGSSMSLAAQISETLADPNVAYLLLTLGLVGIVAELSNPGALFPGITAVIALVLASVGLGGLPVAAAGLVLIGLAVVLLLAEIHVAGLGVLGFAGLAAFALGSVMLFEPSPGSPDAQVSPWLIAVMTAIVAAGFLAVLRATAAAQRAPVRTGIQALIGQVGVADTAVAPTGRVRVDGEEWTAHARDGAIAAGAPVEVIGVEGVTLEIRSLP